MEIEQSHQHHGHGTGMRWLDITVAEWPTPATENPGWTRLREQKRDLQLSVCYCSVFDECYRRTPEQNRPQRADACLKPDPSFYAGLAISDGSAGGPTQRPGS